MSESSVSEKCSIPTSLWASAHDVVAKFLTFPWFFLQICSKHQRNKMNTCALQVNIKCWHLDVLNETCRVSVQQFHITRSEDFYFGALSTCTACSIWFQLLSKNDSDPWKWAHCVFSYSHIMPAPHTYSYSRVGGWEGSCSPESPYHWTFSLQGQWAPSPRKASFFSTYLDMIYSIKQEYRRETIRTDITWWLWVEMPILGEFI